MAKGSETLRPVLIVIAGPNGSGKTSLTTGILQHGWINGCEFINPNSIAKDIYRDWNSLQALLAAANHAQSLRERFLRERKSIAFETVLSGQDKIDFLVRAKNAGYFIRLFFIGTSHPSINAASVAMRVMEGGQDVPIPKIISRYYKSLASCCVAASIADRSYIYDNSVNAMEPQLLYRTHDGVVTKHYSALAPPRWAQIISDNIRATTKDIQKKTPSDLEA